MMLDFNSLVYDHRLGFLGKVQGSEPANRPFNPEAEHMRVSYIHGNQVEYDEWRQVICNTADLQHIKKGTVIKVRPEAKVSGEGKSLGVVKSVQEEYVYLYNGSESDRVWFGDLGAPQPEGTEVERFHRGQLVHLAYESDYVGVVVKVYTEAVQINYKVVYFPKSNMARYQETGVKSDSSQAVIWPAWRLAPYPGVTPPRIRMSDEDREGYQMQFHTQVNEKNYQGYDRFVGMTLATRHSRKVEYRLNGTVIAGAFKAFKNGDFNYLEANAYEIARAFNEIPTLHARRELYYKDNFGNTLSDKNILEWCNNCQHVEVYGEMNYSSQQGYSFCRMCQDQFTWSERMNDYIGTNSAIPLFIRWESYRSDEPDDWVTTSWGNRQDEFFVHGSRAFNSETYSRFLDEMGADSGNASGGELDDYHRATRIWREQWADKSYIPLGLEIEVYAKPRYDVVSFLREEFPNKMYLERDGSLNSSYGFEIITQPYGKKEWEEFAPKLLNLLKKNGAVAYNSPAGPGYGIHINLNRKHLSPLQETRMFMFLAAAENRDFVTAIAQRSNVYRAQVNIGSTIKEDQTVRRFGGLQTTSEGYNASGQRIVKKQLVGVGKYAPIKLHEKRLEIRIFQSTLNGSSFMKNLQFTWAMVEWTSTKSSTGTSWMHTDFVQWLSKRPHAERDYPHLMAFLRKPKFERIDDNKVSNTWLEHMPKETRRSIPAEVLAKCGTEIVEDTATPVISHAAPHVRSPAAEDVSYSLAA
jgi:hypothetical protein